jgi:hypothetical protein
MIDLNNKIISQVQGRAKERVSRTAALGANV